MKIWADFSSILSQSTSLTDGWTDRRSDRILIARPRLHSIQRGINVTFFMVHCVLSTSCLHMCADSGRPVIKAAALILTNRISVVLMQLLALYPFSVGSALILNMQSLNSSFCNVSAEEKSFFFVLGAYHLTVSCTRLDPAHLSSLSIDQAD